MNLGAIFVGLALLVLVIPFVVEPFRRKPNREISAVISDDVIADYSRPQAIISLRDLEFDYQTEKVNEEDYKRLRTKLLSEAAVAIEEERQEEARFEELVRSYRADKSSSHQCLQCGGLIHAGDEYCSGCGSYLISRCRSCNHANKPADKYCSNCGMKINDHS